MSGAGILIRDALLVPNSVESHEPFLGWLTVSGDRISALGRGSPPRMDITQVIDGRGMALIPGLVNVHAHSHSSLTRGSAEGSALGVWLNAIEAEQKRLTYEQAYYGALATYCEALLSGTTSIVDMCLFPDAALKAAKESGIRAVIVPYLADSKSFTPTLDQTAQLLQDPENREGRVRVWCGLHDVESCSDTQIRGAIELAAQYEVGLHLHCAETRELANRTVMRTGHSPVAHLASLDALTPRTLLAHCVWIDEEDQQLIHRAGVHVAHCPVANLKLGSGIAPVPAMNARGVNVALGTDGAKANNSLDMFDTMKFVSLIQKGIHLDPSLLPAAQVIRMATRNGAYALNIPAGTLEPGMLADLALIRLDHFHLQPAIPQTIVTNLVHAARGSDVSLVLVGGQVVVANGCVQSVDEGAIRACASEIGRELMSLTR